MGISIDLFPIGNTKKDPIKQIVGNVPTNLDTLEEISQNAIAADSMGYSTTTTDMSLEFETLDGKSSGSVTFLSATTEQAGVMAAEDKKNLDNMPSTIKDAIAKESKATDEKISKEKTRAEAVEQTLANGVTNAPNLALRALFVAAGATYNESTGYYTVGDLNDITEEEMMKIYAGKEYINNLDKSKALSGNIKFRTMIPTMSASVGQVYTAENPINGDTLCSGNAVLEFFKLTNAQELGDVQYTSTIPYISARMNQTFYGCKNLKVIYPIYFSLVNYCNKTFVGCANLTEVRLYNIKISVSFPDSPLISKDSIIWIIKYAKPTSEITITLHADAYARLANDADIEAALAAQPLVTLVSA